MGKNMFTMPGTGGMQAQLQQMQTTLANPPAVQPPAPMPDPYGPQALAAARLAAAKAYGSAGRQSTILTSPQSRSMGTGAMANYAAKTLGGGS